MIKTVTLSIKARFVASAKDNDKAPDYRIFAGTTEFGAAWKKTARGSEREYLSVKLDDPSFPAPIFASLVRAEGEEDYTQGPRDASPHPVRKGPHNPQGIAS